MKTIEDARAAFRAIDDAVQTLHGYVMRDGVEDRSQELDAIDMAVLPLREIAHDYARKAQLWESAARTIAAEAHLGHDSTWQTCPDTACRIARRAIALAEGWNPAGRDE